MYLIDCGENADNYKFCGKEDIHSYPTVLMYNNNMHP